ncbi:hypothetical protein THASP1DRAFT_33573 [Thamnocephalis sphaerospora]|uniref:Tyrosinase copper-binding domain-containing protein n=1 Tax=Thamnocephalis sphaerospora TaxID=78915 RepID=A0A4P9XG75_9FUNG|nr:hypothetical protein THASP1DRAFT_33573 [Thamnocephalis sphaerospora]|eukprot:RKP04635.1 hypothetical protein THASP1DRAFT_33573 [Thamnocephalis sphaerospora]
MQFNNAFALVGAILLAASGVQADTCTTISKRREFRQLTHAERLTFLNAIKTLHAGPRPSRYQAYVQDYTEGYETSHENAQFLPWHRAYLREVEKSLQAIDSSIMLPYWDWAYDYEAPHTSLVFSPVYFGGNGELVGRGCIIDGVFVGWKPDRDDSCVIRNYDGMTYITPWWSRNNLRAEVFGRSSFKEFYETVDTSYIAVQDGIGGSISTVQSSGDPLFFVAHTFVDKIWADWQKLSEANANAYSGVNLDASEAKKTDTLIYGYRVEDVMDTHNLCYDYDDYNGESNPTTMPPTTTPPTTTPPTTDPPTTTPPTTTPPTTDPPTTTSPTTDPPTTTPPTTDPPTTTPPTTTPPTTDPPTTTPPTTTPPTTDPPTTTTPTTTPTDSYSTTSTSSYPSSSPPAPTYSSTTTGGSLPTTTSVPPYIHSNTPKNDTYVPGHNNGKVYPPAPLPETWCKTNNMPVELVRAVEAAAYKDIEQLNRHPGYISKPDLVSRVDALKQYAKQDEKLINYVGSKVTDIKYDASNPAIVASVRTKVAIVLEQVYKQINIVYPKAAENTYNSANVYSGDKPAKRCRRGGQRCNV